MVEALTAFKAPYSLPKYPPQCVGKYIVLARDVLVQGLIDRGLIAAAPPRRALHFTRWKYASTTLCRVLGLMPVGPRKG